MPAPIVSAPGNSPYTSCRDLGSGACGAGAAGFTGERERRPSVAASGVGDIGEYAEVLRSPTQLRHSLMSCSLFMYSGPSGKGLSWSTTAALKPM